MRPADQSEKVVTLVTGAVRTDFWGHVQVDRVGIPRSSRYWPIRDKVDEIMTGKMDQSSHPSAEAWAKAVVSDLLSSSPPSHIHRGYLASATWWVSWLMPIWLLDWMFSQTTDLRKLKAEVTKAKAAKVGAGQADADSRKGR